jgi:hypothetical protein
MPAAVAVPAIASLAGTAASAIVGHKAQSNAQKSQERANAQALAYQREQDAARRQDYQQAMAVWDANRRALLQRYGVNIGGAPMGQAAGPQRLPMGQAGGQMAGPAVPGGMGGGRPMPGRPTNLREILMAKGVGGMPDVQGGWRRRSAY